MHILLLITFLPSLRQNRLLLLRLELALLSLNRVEVDVLKKQLVSELLDVHWLLFALAQLGLRLALRYLLHFECLILIVFTSGLLVVLVLLFFRHVFPRQLQLSQDLRLTVVRIPLDPLENVLRHEAANG